ncbi:MAG: hypothetical protein NTY66_00540 [Candidatus Vogelbacteria bacterium]|nr:hypothetical protein [Candidatus Vogelbacteria bacterium]
MVLRKNFRRHKGNSTTKLIIWLAVLIVLAFGVRFWQTRESSVNENRTATSTSVVSTSTASVSSWTKLRDRAGIFEVSYPRRVFKLAEKPAVVPSAWTEKTRAQVLTHTIPIQHCGLSGLPEHCTPSTTDISISFFVLERSFNDVFKELKKTFGDLPVVTLDGHQGVRFEQGVEGEGIVYTVLPVNDTKTLFIGRSYLDEQIVGGYKGAKDFIRLAEQKKLYDEVIATFKFRPAF